MTFARSSNDIGLVFALLALFMPEKHTANSVLLTATKHTVFEATVQVDIEKG